MQVLVSTFAAGINFADLLITQGKYQIRPETPFVPGKFLFSYQHPFMCIFARKKRLQLSQLAI